MNEATPPSEGQSDAVSEPQRVWLRLRQVFGAPRKRRELRAIEQTLCLVVLHKP